jgi:hypothetical protein
LCGIIGVLLVVPSGSATQLPLTGSFSESVKKSGHKKTARLAGGFFGVGCFQFSSDPLHPPAVRETHKTKSKSGWRTWTGAWLKMKRIPLYTEGKRETQVLRNQLAYVLRDLNHLCK